MKLLGIFGGTFDPVHCGHLRAMLELQETLGLDQLRVMPCGIPAHRPPPAASAAARVAMLEAALEDFPGAEIDRRELEREGVSYTVDTLVAMSEQFPGSSLCLLLGQDAFLGLPGWHRWTELFDLAHVAVARRPGGSLLMSPPLAEAVRGRRCDAPGELRDSASGRVIFCETSQLEISSSWLRAQAAADRSLRWLVPGSVEAIIEAEGLYR